MPEPIDDRIDIGTAMKIASGGRPMACCPTDGEPLVSTFERPGAEFVCAVCGRWLGFLSPTPKDSTPELEARQEELAAAWKAGTSPAQLKAAEPRAMP